MVRNGRQGGFTPIRVAEERPNETEMLSRRRAADHRGFQRVGANLYGTPYDGGPQYGSGGGDQYGYGPAYSYACQAPNRYPYPY